MSVIYANSGGSFKLGCQLASVMSYVTMMLSHVLAHYDLDCTTDGAFILACVWQA